MPIKAILYDQGGVTVKVDNDKTLQRICRPFDEPHDVIAAAIRLRQAIFGPQGLNNEYAWGRMPTWQFLRGLLKLPDIHPGFDGPNDPRLVNAYADVFTPHQPMLRLLLQIRSMRTHWQHLQLMAISNTEPLRADRLYRMGVLGLFDKRVFSYRVRSCKPDERIYRYALARLDVRPDEAILVDDLEENLRAANRIGIRGFHYRAPDAATHGALRRYLASYGVPIDTDEEDW